MTMIIGAGLDARLGLPFAELRDVAREAARLRFESLWTPAGGVPDSFHVCAFWSQDTGLRTGISVVPAARMWTPLGAGGPGGDTGAAVGGRFVLGLGTGGYGPDSGRRSACRTGRSPSCATTSPRSAACWPGETVTSAGPALGLPAGPVPPRSASATCRRPGVPGGAGPADAQAGRRDRRRRAAQLGDPGAGRGQPSLVAEGAARAGPGPAEVPLTMYIRVCIDDDVAAARRAFGTQVLGYAMAQPGMPADAGTARCSRRWASTRRCRSSRTAGTQGLDHGTSGRRPRRDAPGGRLLRPAGPSARRLSPVQRRAGRGHRPDHHRPPRPGSRG